MVAPTPNAPCLTGPTSRVDALPDRNPQFRPTVASATTRRGSPPPTWQTGSDVHRAYVYLDDPKGCYGGLMAPPFARAAQRLGIRVIGPDSPSGGFRRLARSLKARGVDGVFLASQTVRPATHSALFARGLGQSATLIGADTFLPLHRQRRRGSPSGARDVRIRGGRHRPSPTAATRRPGVRSRLRHHPPSRR